MEFLRSILEWIVALVGPLVAPDWAALIRLIPIGVLLLVAGFYLWVLLRYRSAGRRRIGMRLRAARPPAGIHLPGPSIAPLLVSAGAGALFFSVALGGAALAVAASLFVLALLAWGREAVHEYDALGGGRDSALTTTSTDTAPSGPPDGVHLLPPSLLPLLVSLSAAVLLFGVAVGASIAILGALMTALALVGWLVDAGREYRATADADATGHLVSPTPRRAPIAAIALLSLLFVVVGGTQAGILPPKFGAASPAPSGDGGSPAPSGDASAAPSGTCDTAGSLSANAGAASDVTVAIVAEGVKYLAASVEAPADVPFAMTFENRDAGIPHNVAIHVGGPGCVGAELWKGAIFPGIATQTYNVPALAAGSYVFVCTVHPNMIGTLTVR